MVDAAGIQLRFEALDPVLDERGRRRFAAAEARAAGRGGVSAVARMTGLARSTIGRGLAELRVKAAEAVAPGRTRRPGGGRKKLTETDPTLLADLQDLVEPATRGDPQAGYGEPQRARDRQKIAFSAVTGGCPKYAHQGLHRRAVLTRGSFGRNRVEP